MSATLVILPTGLKPPDGNIYLAALVQREQPNDSGAAVYLGKNYAFNGDPSDSYLLLARLRRFAWAGNLASDFLAATAPISVANTPPELPPEVPVGFTVVPGCTVQLSGPDLILDEVTDFDALAGTLLVFVDAEIMSISEADLSAVGAYSLTVVRGMFGTTIADHLAGAPLAIVRRSDVIPFTHPSFQNGNVSQCKVTIGVGNAADAEMVAFPIGGSGASLTFTSVSPNTCAQNGSCLANIYGTGFTGSGINLIKADDGAGHAPNAVTTLESDTDIYIIFTGLGLTPAGVYTLYYSTDNGTTWTTTGKTITSS